MNRLATIAAACALALAGSVQAADTDTTYSDQMFFTNAAIGGMAEVDAGKLASAKGNSKDVRGFGQKMVSEHSKNNDELKQLAAKKNVQLPATTDAKHQEMLAKLQGLSGDAFDREYAADMVKGHEQMAALLERAARESKDADVRMFATDTLAAVHMHHQLAVDLQQTEMAEATE